MGRHDQFKGNYAPGKRHDLEHLCTGVRGMTISDVKRCFHV